MEGRSHLPSIRIGTSGWHYRHWVGPFYPDDLAADEYLSAYAAHLDTVEVNNTFYRLVQAETMRRWRDSVPDDFEFAVKGSRYITHLKKLRDPQKPLARFMESIEGLGDKLGPILFQLPPNWGVDADRLKAFLNALSEGPLYAFEFREASWFDQGVYKLLARHHVALCIHDMYGQQTPHVMTADHVYVRMHGVSGGYQGRYSADDLARLASHLADWRDQGRRVYCYFNNDQHGYAVYNALELGALSRKTG
jgi:uncharacterized protein YecE (DUF72 family)